MVWNFPFRNVDNGIDIEKNVNIYIGNDIDIGQIKPIFVDFHEILQGLLKASLNQLLLNYLYNFANNLNSLL